MIPALLLILFLVTLLEGLWLLTILVVTWFAYWYPAWWLFIVAVMVDAYFGAFSAVPVLSLVFGAFVLFTETLKIQLLGTARYE